MGRQVRWAGLVGVGLVGAVALGVGCSAGIDDGGASGSYSGPGGTGGASSGPGGPGASSGGGDIFVTTGGGNGGDAGGIPVNPCGTECGPVELCDGQHQGVDDDCDGQVDEGCPCSGGQASACFRGDPSYRNTPGCFDGTMYCTELGTWGPCLGGRHAAAPDFCFNDNPDSCQPISAVPFQTVNLNDGTGNFSNDALSGSFTVACPAGVDPCPAVQGGSNFQPLQSGEYTVTYTKTTSSGTETCTFPLRVGARGLRVEMEWNWGGGSRDLDLHLHQPDSTAGWAPVSTSATNSANCGFHNCKLSNLTSIFPSGIPTWFPVGPVPFGDPVRWYLDPVQQANTCYFAPRGVGAQWQSHGQGCHNPRLDLDNISCDAAVTDPNNSSFCAPENVNVDFPPLNKWMRIGVFNYSTSPAESLRPTIKVFCDGALAAELGPEGFNQPVVVPARQMWTVADVLFQDDGCVQRCVVEPIYQSSVNQTPYLMTQAASQASVGAPYKPIPTP